MEDLRKLGLLPMSLIATESEVGSKGGGKSNRIKSKMKEVYAGMIE